MSEKRFIIENERTVYDSLLHRGFVCSWKVDAEELVGLLNNLNDENEQLRNENERLKSQQKWTEETLQKKLIVEIKPDLYGWKANVKELENE